MTDVSTRTIPAKIPARLDRLPWREGRRAAPVRANGANPGPLIIDHFIGAAVMFAGGVVAWYLRVNAERRPPEGIVTPLSAVPGPPFGPQPGGWR